MARRAALSLVRPQAVRPRAALPSARAAALTVGLLAALALAYLVARETPLFALRTVTIEGAPRDVARSVRTALRAELGESLVVTDADALARRLELLPSVRAAAVDRAFPHTLRVVVQPERPLAVLRVGRGAWLVSERGRVLEPVEAGTREGLPRVWVGGESFTPGQVVPAVRGGLAVRALTDVPKGFPVPIETARVHEGEVTMMLEGRLELRLGSAAELALKLEVAGSVLGALSADERLQLGYLDVTVPQRPVVGP